MVNWVKYAWGLRALVTVGVETHHQKGVKGFLGFWSKLLLCDSISRSIEPPNVSKI